MLTTVYRRGNGIRLIESYRREAESPQLHHHRWEQNQRDPRFVRGYWQIMLQDS